MEDFASTFGKSLKGMLNESSKIIEDISRQDVKASGEPIDIIRTKISGVKIVKTPTEPQEEVHHTSRISLVPKAGITVSDKNGSRQDRVMRNDEPVSEEPAQDFQIQPVKKAQTAEELWNRVLDILSSRLKEKEVRTWLLAVTPKSLSNGTLTVLVPSDDYYNMIDKRYGKQIKDILSSGEAAEGSTKLEYEVSQLDLFSTDNAQYLRPASQKKISSNAAASAIQLTGDESTPNSVNLVKIKGTKTDEDDFQSNLFPKYTFDNFVKGDNNELAVAAAYAIANNPGKTYNPLFIYGGVGLGKTHLIQAIGNEIMKKYPDKRVYYTNTPDFTTQFTTNIAREKFDVAYQKIGSKKLDSFYKSLDVLILDDIQHLSGKEKTQDFIYQIFNTLFNENKHIIFSSDKPVNQIKGIEERLLSRFQWGITADIQVPNWETRVAIIKRKFEEIGTDAPEEVIHHIANNIKDSIRTVEGCIAGIMAESVLVQRGEITMEIAETVIKRVIGSVKKTKTVSIESIISTVANYYKVSESNILSKKRTKEIALARQVAMFLAKEQTSLTLEFIGLNFGGKDHATVLYSYNAINQQIKKDSDIGKQVAEIRERLKNI